MNNIRILLSCLMMIQLVCPCSLADEYDAIVTTDSGSYLVPVEVEDGEVTHVYWPNGGAMNVMGGTLDGGYAVGTNSRSETIEIDIGYEE